MINRFARMIASKRISILFLLLSLSFNVVLAETYYYDPTELSFILYADGFAAVEYSADIDPIRPRVNVTLFGSLFLDILVEDQDGLLLGYSFLDDGISIDTLGSISVKISYFTQDLTDKSGQIWTFSIVSPVDVSIILPGGSTIVSLSSVPISMSNLGDNLLLTMSKGEITISYTIGISGTRERAIAVINDAENVIDDIKSDGIIVDNAEALLQLAREAFDDELYAEAEQLAEDAKDSAFDSKSLAESAFSWIEEDRNEIKIAENNDRTIGIEIAKNLLQESEFAYDNGNYTKAEELAKSSISAALDATKEEGLSIIWIGAILVVVVLAIGIFIIINRRESGKVIDSPAKFDLDRLFEEHPHLRLDDQEVLRFLADSGGGVFAAELRERFNVPRTSLWRMIRRLEREEVVVVSSIGGQSLVNISQKYQEGGKLA
jgi:uncharacterized membrane protein